MPGKFATHVEAGRLAPDTTDIIVWQRAEPVAGALAEQRVEPVSGAQADRLRSIVYEHDPRAQGKITAFKRSLTLAASFFTATLVFFGDSRDPY